MNIKWIGAHPNNFAVGREGKVVDTVVLHWIVGSLESADATFAKPDRIASAHYGVGDNDIHQYVKEEDTAYHAGNLTVNRKSIGIEHEGGPDLPVTEATVQTSIKLVAEICKRFSIPADKDHIKRHSDIKATQCPGTLPVERIIEEVGKLLAPPPGELPFWFKGLLQENGVEISKAEGWFRELLGKAKERDSAIKERDKANVERAGAEGRAAELETNLITANKNLMRTTGDLDQAKRTIINKDIEISDLKRKLESVVVPSSNSRPGVIQRLVVFIFNLFKGKR